ncbi:MAG: APC family permease [Sporichthyaceae bacterium]|nr:APC family permease [Sporichthyaceae bacterium]
MADTAVRGQLASDAVGLREVLFQSITHMAPGAAVAFSITVGAQFAGGALPLSVILALVGCVLVALSIGQLAKHLPSAAGFATYASRGLHPAIGFVVAWGYALAEALVAPLLYLIFGLVVAGTLQAEYGWAFDTWWPVATIAAALLVFLFGWFGVRFSTGTGTLLGLFEIGVFAALAVWLIVEAGDGNTLEVFGTTFANNPAFSGFSGVIAGSVFTILAFIGFEAAVPLAEETRNPRRTVQVAVVASAVLIGLFYVLTTYAAAVYFGPAEFTGFAPVGANPWQDDLARTVWGGAWVLVFAAVIISAVANSNAAANATTRTWYALGRARLLTAMLTETHPRWKSPHLAVLVQFGLAVSVALTLGLVYGPGGAFGLVATMVTAVIIGIYILLNLACIGYYLRERRSEFNPLLHLIIPLLGVAAFVPAILTALGIKAFDFVTPLTEPLSYAGPVVGGWLVLGLLYLGYLLATGKTDRLAALGLVYGGEQAPEATVVDDEPDGPSAFPTDFVSASPTAETAPAEFATTEPATEPVETRATDRKVESDDDA